MKKEQGFSLVELLIVVAIIAIIAAIAIPSMLTARKASNEAGAIQGCRTAGSAQVAFASTNNQNYTTLQILAETGFLDGRYISGFNGYNYTDETAIACTDTICPPMLNADGGFSVTATPASAGAARYTYGIAADQVVRYLGTNDGTVPTGLSEGDAIGKAGGSGGGP